MQQLGMQLKQHRVAATDQGKQQPQQTAQLSTSHSASTHGPRLPLRPKSLQQKRGQAVPSILPAKSQASDSIRANLAHAVTALSSGQENSLLPLQLSPAEQGSAGQVYQPSPVSHQALHAYHSAPLPLHQQSQLQPPEHLDAASQSSQERSHPYYPAFTGNPHTQGAPAALPHQQSYLQQPYAPGAAIPLGLSGNPDQHPLGDNSMASQAHGLAQGLQHSLLGDERSAGDAAPMPAGEQHSTHPARLGKTHSCTCAGCSC